MADGPKSYQGIMLSSTFTDLEEHRKAAIAVMPHHQFFPNVMEFSGASIGPDVLDKSLKMVADSVAYVLVIGHRYGQLPVDPVRNPGKRSITELEFNAAIDRGLPILLFVMSDDHPVTKSTGGWEASAAKAKKLKAFISRAKLQDPRDPSCRVERAWQTFDSKDDFTSKFAIAIGKLAPALDSRDPAAVEDAAIVTAHDKLDRQDEKIEAILAAVGKLSIPDRAVREAISRFIDVKPEASEPELIQAVERFETDYRALQAQLAAVTVVDNRVTALKADAEIALANGDLDKARTAYREASEAARERAVEPVRTTAQLIAAEANAHLLALDWEAADKAWSEAAAMLAPFDRMAAEAILEETAHRLFMHSQRFGKAGALDASIRHLRAWADAVRARGDLQEAARLQNNLGITLRNQGLRTSGAAGLRLLAEAVAAYHEALSVRTRAVAPLDWATTQNNLGAALATLGARADSAEAPRLLDEAIAAFRAVLTVYTREEMRSDWATTQHNLGAALATLGMCTKGREGLRLLHQAVAAYRDALSVYTRAETPADWATVHNNLGLALAMQGSRTRGAKALHLLAEAVAAYREALSIRTRVHTPAQWATTQENLGRAYELTADADKQHAHQHLVKAEEALAKALSIYKPEQMVYYDERTTRHLSRVGKKLAGLER